MSGTQDNKTLLKEYIEKIVKGLDENNIDYETAVISNVWYQSAITAIVRAMMRFTFSARSKVAKQFFQDPNRYTSNIEFFKLFLNNYFVYGRALIWYTSPSTFADKQFYVIDNNNFEFVENKYGDIIHVLIQDGDVQRKVKLDDVIFLRTADSKSVFEKAKVEIYAIAELNKFVAAFFNNNATPNTVLLLEERLSDNQEKTFLRRWMDKFRGSKNAGKVALLSGTKGQIVPVGVSLDKTMVIDLENIFMEKILGLMGVPPAIVGVYRYANYANSEQQKEIFLENTVFPLTRIIVNQFNLFLKAQSIKDSVSIILDTKEETLDEKLDLALKLQQLGYSKQEIENILNVDWSAGEPTKSIEIKKELIPIYEYDKTIKYIEDNIVSPLKNKLHREFKNALVNYFTIIRRNTIKSFLKGDYNTNVEWAEEENTLVEKLKEIVDKYKEDINKLSDYLILNKSLDNYEFKIDDSFFMYALKDNVLDLKKLMRDTIIKINIENINKDEGAEMLKNSYAPGDKAKSIANDLTLLLLKELSDKLQSNGLIRYKSTDVDYFIYRGVKNDK